MWVLGAEPLQGSTRPSLKSSKYSKPAQQPFMISYVYGSEVQGTHLVFRVSQCRDQDASLLWRGSEKEWAPSLTEVIPCCVGLKPPAFIWWLLPDHSLHSQPSALHHVLVFSLHDREYSLVQALVRSDFLWLPLLTTFKGFMGHVSYTHPD